ncbi:hypothetical protein CRE_02601 [Caenorhabditis remanei]|uniref:Uncharacterized protein n=1 Tax=Caenorhabditis remanei TaxID=31234 RepID=E3N9V6_CAERE|nr:hypothetical protein CRE_02601 [Caenorhabditis remanei]
MFLSFPFFTIAALEQFIVPNKFSIAPEGSKEKFIQEYSWHQFVLLALTIAVGFARGVPATDAPDEPQRLSNVKKPMYFVIGYGIFQAILGISLTFLYSPDSETRYLITTVSQILLVMLLSYYAAPMFFTCTMWYTWVIFPAIICMIGGCKALFAHQLDCYKTLFIFWIMMIFFGLLDMYLMAVNHIYDGCFHFQHRAPTPCYPEWLMYRPPHPIPTVRY